ncbi:MAG: hypothetical protein K5622_06460 [Endomicrobiaceae bacterium]|nr:hypothetical protein [Endomicrobiaceae bacterium]
MSYIVFIIYGIISIFLQIFFIREFVPLFHGSEFVIGIVFGHWLLSAAVANFFSQYFKKIRDFFSKSVNLFITLIIFIILSFVFIRNINAVSSTDIAIGISLKSLFCYSFIAIFPVSFSLNLILNFLKQSFSNVLYQKKVKRYVCEAIGFVIGGTVFSLFMSSIPTTGLLLITIMLIFCNLIYLCESIIVKIFYLVLFCLSFYLIKYHSLDLEKYIFFNINSNNNIIDVSYYKNIQDVLTEKNGEYFFYKNGNCEFALPSPDIFDEEDFAHLPILHHTNPKKLLLIGGVKYLSSIVKYDLEKIDFVEQNLNMIQVLKQNINKLNNIFDDKRINIYSEDARKVLQNNKEKYDVVLIGLDIPLNTSINKFYTYEFFKILSNKLTEDGFLALSLPGSMVYSPSLMFELNASVYGCIKKIFPYVQIIPGKTNILVASKSKMPFRLHIKKRLKHVEDETFVLSKYYVDERMDTQRTKWLNFQIKKYNNKKILNKDSNQKALLFSIMYWQSKFSPFLMKFLRISVNYSYFVVLIAVILFFSVKFKYPVTAFVSGASAMWLQFVCFWGFQIYVGQIYQWFGLLTAIFMLGLVIGSLYSKYYQQYTALNKTFFSSEILYILWILSFIVVIKYKLLNIYSLSILSFGVGGVTGLEFAQLIKIFSIMKEGKNNVVLFFADALGGAFACYFGGAYIIPIWGIKKSLMFVLFLKFLIFTWWQYDKKHGL